MGFSHRRCRHGQKAGLDGFAVPAEGTTLSIGELGGWSYLFASNMAVADGSAGTASVVIRTSNAAGGNTSTTYFGSDHEVDNTNYDGHNGASAADGQGGYSYSETVVGDDGVVYHRVASVDSNGETYVTYIADDGSIENLNAEQIDDLVDYSDYNYGNEY